MSATRSSTALVLLGVSVYLFSCQAPRFNQSAPLPFVSGSAAFYLQDTLRTDSTIVFSKEVILLPGAYILTEGTGKVVFTHPWIVLGGDPVFSTETAVEFLPGTLSEIYPGWFGANGMDHIDDTKAFQKALAIARAYENSVTIRLPIGQYRISRTLEVSADRYARKSIHWLGASMSNSGTLGSSLIWTGPKGGTLLRFSDLNQFCVNGIDFKSDPETYLQYNLEFKPYLFQAKIQHCHFSGAAGNGSANINLNQGDNLQVSEIEIDNCAFYGMTAPSPWLSPSAIVGGLANSKNFYITHSQFSGYDRAAIDIEVSDIVEVENNTFSRNAVDINCLLCGVYIANNYSEHSKAFFNSTLSTNPSFVTMVNNRFSGEPGDGYVIQNGMGHLVLINNFFGASGVGDDRNRIRWKDDPASFISSTGNFYKNASPSDPPFYNERNEPKQMNVRSFGDLGGGEGLRKVQLSSTH